MAKWTAAQVNALAPDDSSAKAGQKLADTSKWVTLGSDEQTAWGQCKGSGKKPYQTRIDLAGPAFKCSCPSRKFPCKHSLGLLLLYAQSPKAFTETTPPDYVTEWIESRQKRAERKAEREKQKDKPVDAKAQAKRVASRENKVEGGIQELKSWLEDLVRQGLTTAQNESYSFWEQIAARMVDAQAPGLARELRAAATITGSGAEWGEKLLRHLSHLYLLLCAYERQGELSPEEQADVRSLVGWTEDQAALLKTDGVKDTWRVLGQTTTTDERLRVQRTWLQGQSDGRAALVLAFAAGGEPLDVSLVPGLSLEAELVFFPGTWPVRALIKSRNDTSRPLEDMTGCNTISQGLDQCAQVRTRIPWLASFPLALDNVIPAGQDGRFFVVDQDKRALPLRANEQEGWQLIAMSGGHPVSVFGEWDGATLRPLSSVTDGTFLSFQVSEA